MIRSPDQWRTIQDGKTWNEFAEFILGDLWHYSKRKQRHRQDDIAALANALQAIAHHTPEE